jgi:hypothetical protein
MKAKTVSFKEIEEAHRRERAEDARRLALHLVTQEELQEENSLIPKNTRIEIVDLAAFARKHYDY